MTWPNATSTGSIACLGDGVGTGKSSCNDDDKTTDDHPHTMLWMFRANSHFEIPVSQYLEAPGSIEQKFSLVEQCLNVPLWHLQLMPKVPPGSDEMQCTTLYLATEIEYVLEVLEVGWASSKIHILLPDYAGKSDSPTLVRCLAIWECSASKRETRARWLIETETGSFSEPPESDSVALKKMKKVALRWQAVPNQTETPGPGPGPVPAAKKVSP